MAEAIFFRFMLMMTMWLPWRTEWLPTVGKAPLDIHMGCQGAWLGKDEHIHICLGEQAGYYPQAVIHELQHWLCSTQTDGQPWDWEKFGRLAMRSLREGDYNRDQIHEAKYFLSYGGHELHAQLPWITRGKIPPCLQDYYPWFDLGDGYETND